MGVYWTFRQFKKKRLFVYLSFNLYHFGQMWHLCTIYCFQMYCAMNSGFSEKKTGPQKLMEQIWYSCRVRRDLHLFNATFRATLNTVLPGTYEALFSSCSTSLSQYFIRTLYWCKFCGFAVPIFSLSGAGTSVVLSFKITVKLKILNLASGASQIDTEKEL